MSTTSNQHIKTYSWNPLFRVLEHMIIIKQKKVNAAQKVNIYYFILHPYKLTTSEEPCLVKTTFSIYYSNVTFSGENLINAACAPTHTVTLVLVLR